MSRLPIKPGVFVQNVRIQPQSIEGVGTSTAAFLGETELGPTMPTLVTSWVDYQRLFGGYFGEGKYMPYAVEGFFENGGQRCYVCRVTNGDYASALALLEAVEEVSIVYAPNAQAVTGLSNRLIAHCERLKNRFTILDSLRGETPSYITKPNVTSFAALYCPWIYVKQVGTSQMCLVPPGGHVAGIYARVDIERGVHKAPANEVVRGAVDLEAQISQQQQDILIPRGINCIRSFSDRGIRVWGARTLSDDTLWKYVNVCRLFLYLENSILKGTQWVVFEVNDEKLWAKVTQMVGGFLEEVWRSGALMGSTPKEAYFVRCDRTTMTQNDLDSGKLILLVGVAPVKPSEFVIFRVGQWQGGSTVTE
jgi:uncharacterized protein